MRSGAVDVFLCSLIDEDAKSVQLGNFCTALCYGTSCGNLDSKAR